MERSTRSSPAELTVVVVSWNTRELILRCLETLFDTARGVSMQVIVADNNSEDGSADAIAQRFPQVRLLRNRENLGFARANNDAVKLVDSEWLLLLNPDTEVHPHAVKNLLAFSQQHPEAGITGGRTVFPDGSLNMASCWNKMGPWSLFCSFTGLSWAFSRTTLFNPEAIGGWRRDRVRHVDIVVGCFLMIRTALWKRLGGFDPRYFMFGDDADLCLRAAALGYRPMITPDAQIMHRVGASAPKAVKMLQLWRAKATLVRGHWPKLLAPVGLGELWLCCATRCLGAAMLGILSRRGSRYDVWREMWAKRCDWLKGY
ncbi:MAG: glycosyltransferase family 2 protein [Hyphomicrobiales bacterium]|nr:glycosyltransferase family 2 protein [Hyphomicrobiales bacterium]